METEKRKTLTPGQTLALKSDRDLVKIREFGRTLAKEMGFSESDRTIIATALSEICRNVIEYADQGEVTIDCGGHEKDCIIITISDDGPGIDDVDQALQEGFSSGMGLGIGLPGAKRIMDSFEIITGRDKGTTIKMCKWLNNKNHVFR